MPNLGDYSVPEAAQAEEVGEGLLASGRDCVAQIGAYEAFQGKAHGSSAEGAESA